MAYVPPHKRQSNDSSIVPSPIPSSLIVKHKHFWPHSRIVKHKRLLPHECLKAMYGDQATRMWFAVGTIDDDGHFPSSLHLKPSWVKQAYRIEQDTFVLLNDDPNADNIAMRPRPWVLIAERVKPQLFSSFQHLRKQNLDLKPAFVARFGKLLFSNFMLETFDKSCLNETGLSKLKRVFHTNLPAYMDNIVGGLASKMGLASVKEKEMYVIKLSDSTRPASTILSCRCRVRAQDNKLELHKIELNQVRHMVADISCLDKNLDLRLMLCTRRTETALTDEEKNEISAIVNSAILDPDVKGLKWSQLEEPSSGDRDRFSVVGIWHTISTTYRNSSMSFNVCDADRYDFRTSIWEATTEIHLNLKGIVSQLQKRGEVDLDLVSGMLRESLKMIWDNFLCYDHSFT